MEFKRINNNTEDIKPLGPCPVKDQVCRLCDYPKDICNTCDSIQDICRKYDYT